MNGKGLHFLKARYGKDEIRTLDEIFETFGFSSTQLNTRKREIGSMVLDMGLHVMSLKVAEAEKKIADVYESGFDRILEWVEITFPKLSDNQGRNAVTAHLSHLRDKRAVEGIIDLHLHRLFMKKRLLLKENLPIALRVFAGVIIAGLGWLWGSREKAV